MRYKLDKNHQDIVNAFRGLGCLVWDDARSESKLAGRPDTTVGIFDHRRGRGVIVLVEIKTNDGKLSPAQERFFDDWSGLPVFEVRTVDEVIDIYERVQRGEL